MGPRVRSHYFPQPTVPALVEEVQVELAEGRPMAVRVVKHKARRSSIPVAGLQSVADSRRVERALPQPRRVDLVHCHSFERPLRSALAADKEVHPGRPRPQRPHYGAVASEQ
jgi:hypothetical protein